MKPGMLLVAFAATVVLVAAAGNLLTNPSFEDNSAAYPLIEGYWVTDTRTQGQWGLTTQATRTSQRAHIGLWSMKINDTINYSGSTSRGHQAVVQFIPIAAIPHQPGVCSDSDGGFAPYNRGWVGGQYPNGTNFSFYDACQGRTLVEQYCSGAAPQGAQVSCTQGCTNASCVQPLPNQTNETGQCTDTDGGLMPYSGGRVGGVYSNGTNFTFYDACRGGYLHEQYCSGRDPQATVMDCGPWGCTNASCVQPPPANLTNQTYIDTSAWVLWESGSAPALYLEFLNSDKARLAVYQSYPLVRGAWSRVAVPAQTAPAGTAYVKTVLYSCKPCTGVSYWDDVEMNAQK